MEHKDWFKQNPEKASFDPETIKKKPFLITTERSGGDLDLYFGFSSSCF